MTQIVRTALLFAAIACSAVAASTAQAGDAADGRDVLAPTAASDAAAVLAIVARVDDAPHAVRREAVDELVALPAEQRIELLRAYASVSGDSMRPQRTELLGEVFRRLGPTVLQQLLVQATSAEASLADRSVALFVVRTHELRGGLRILIAAANSEEPAELERTFVKGAYRAAASAVLKREPGGAGLLHLHMSGLPHPVQEAFLDAIESVPDLRNTRDMSRFLGGDDAVLRSVLARMIRLPIVDENPLVEESRSRLSWLLQDGDPEIRRLAALTVARFHVSSHTATLVQMLDDPAQSVAAAAHKSLQALSGARLLGRSDLWQQWVESDAAWRRDHFDATVDAALSRDPAAARRGFVRVVQHRFHRDDFLPRLTEAQSHRDPGVRCALARSLGTLGSPRALPVLLRLLEDEDSDVATAASASLAKITGLRAPGVPREWSARLRLR